MTVVNMNDARAKKQQPENVVYRGCTITMTYRPRYNDWRYSFSYDMPFTIVNMFPRYDTALTHAKKMIDTFLDKQQALDGKPTT